MTVMTGACEKCVLEPCAVCAAARAVVGAWARERKHQLGDRRFHQFVVPDQDAMKASVAKALEPHVGKSCDCKCHSKAKVL